MHLNMEGTKHEKAVLVILSYVVGFTAGFITFGLTIGSVAEVNIPATEVVSVPPESMSDVTENSDVVTSENTMIELDTQAPVVDGVVYEGGRLTANVNGASVLLSAKLTTVDQKTAKMFANQGVHESIPKYTASPDGSFIYYCEQHSTEPTCVNFVYSVDEAMIHYVTVNGVKLVTSLTESESANFTEVGLQVNGLTSVDVTTPWKLTSVE